MRLPKDHLVKIVRDLGRVLAPPLAVLAVHILRQLLWPFASQWDMLMHFLGGASIAASTGILYQVLRRRDIVDRIPFVLLGVMLVTMTVTVGVFWEFFEWLMFHTVWTVPARLDVWSDTLQDLAFDTLGATITVAILGLLP